MDRTLAERFITSRRTYCESSLFYRPCLKLKSGGGKWYYFTWDNARQDYISKAHVLELDSCFDFMGFTEAAEVWHTPPRLETLILKTDLTEVIIEFPDEEEGRTLDDWLAEQRANRFSGTARQTEAEEVRDILAITQRYRGSSIST